MESNALKQQRSAPDGLRLSTDSIVHLVLWGTVAITICLYTTLGDRLDFRFLSLGTMGAGGLSIANGLGKQGWLKSGILLSIGFAVPSLFVLLLSRAYCHFQALSMVYSVSWFAGLVGLNIMTVSLLARKYWWLACSFLFPTFFVYCFWAIYHLLSGSEQPESVFEEYLWLFALIKLVATKPEEFCAYGWAWGAMGLILSAGFYSIFKSLKLLYAKYISSRKPGVSGEDGLSH